MPTLSSMCPDQYFFSVCVKKINVMVFHMSQNASRRDRVAQDAQYASQIDVQSHELGCQKMFNCCLNNIF